MQKVPTISAIVAALMGQLGIEPPRLYERKPAKVYNHTGTKVRNPKVAFNVQRNHELWLRDCFPSRVTKKPADPKSITSIKTHLGCHRSVARRVAAEWQEKYGN